MSRSHDEATRIIDAALKKARALTMRKPCRLGFLP